jgi:hypothetical protein
MHSELSLKSLPMSTSYHLKWKIIIFPILLNDKDFSMMIDSVPANPVEDGGVVVAKMGEKILKGLCANGYPIDVMGYHRELTSHIRDYNDSIFVRDFARKM